MCHTIKYRDPDVKYYKGEASNFIIGTKIFTCSSNMFLASPYLTYEFEKSEKIYIDEFGINIVDEVKKQKANIIVPYTNCTTQGLEVKQLNTSIDVIAGMHVAPIYDFATERIPNGDALVLIDNELLSKKGKSNAEKAARVYYSITELTKIPIMFLLQDILFYDGDNVSVKRIIISNPKLMRVAINDINKKDKEVGYTRKYMIRKMVKGDNKKIINMKTELVSVEEWLEEYEKFYKHLTKKVKSINKERKEK